MPRSIHEGVQRLQPQRSQAKLICGSYIVLSTEDWA